MTRNVELNLAYAPREDVRGTAENFVMNAREQFVFEIINEKFRRESKEDKIIGIIYGAGHMKTISRFLIDQLGYIPRNGKFLEVFPIN